MRTKWAARGCRVLLLVAVSVGIAACENVLSPYRGPRPATDGITSEVVVVRYLRTQDNPSYIVDRTRFVNSGDPHDVDRVVWVFTNEATVAQVGALELQVGDTIVISTRYSGVREVGALEAVPNWPGHKYYEYPIATHQFTAIRRAP